MMAHSLRHLTDGLIGCNAFIIISLKTHTPPHFNKDSALTQHKVFLGQHMACTVDIEWQDIGTKFVGQIKSAFMETQNAVICTTSGFGEDDDAITFLVKFA